MSGHPTLTPERVRWMRKKHALKVKATEALERRYSKRGLAQTLGVSTNTVDRALRRMTWKHVQ